MNKLFCENITFCEIQLIDYLIDGPLLSYHHLYQSNWCRVVNIRMINLCESHFFLIAWLFLMFVQSTCINCARSFFWFFINNSCAYTWCKRNTDFFTLGEHVIVNLFQFWMTNNMTKIVFIFDLILESWSEEWILLAVSILQV